MQQSNSHRTDVGCYFCGAPETSKEHVPPKWVFPKPADTPPGVSYRPALMITVPSCDAHNTRKSRDDSYLMHVVTMCQGVNAVGLLQIAKILRAYRERPALLKKMMSTERPVVPVDHNDGTLSDAIATAIEPGRISDVLKMLAHANYFAHFGRRPPSPAWVVAEFIGSERPSWRKRFRQAIRLTDAAFSERAHLGAVPEVWSYQILEDDHSVAMRFHLYGGVRFMAIFGLRSEDG